MESNDKPIDHQDEQIDQANIETDAVEQWEAADLLDRPRWPKVIGIISIIYAALGLTCGGLGTVMASFTPSFVKGSLNGDPMPDGMLFHAQDYAIAGVGIVLAVVLLFAGIAAVSYRPLTRVLHLVYAGVSLPLTVLSYLNQTAKQESLQQWAQQYPDNPLAQSLNASSNPAASVGQLLGLVVLIVFGFGVPVFYLIWFGLLKTKPEQITGGDEGVY